MGYESDFEIPYELLHFTLLDDALEKLLHFSLEKLLHFALNTLLHFASMFITFFGDCYYILR